MINHMPRRGVLAEDQLGVLESGVETRFAQNILAFWEPVGAVLLAGGQN